MATNHNLIASVGAHTDNINSKVVSVMFSYQDDSGSYLSDYELVANERGLSGIELHGFVSDGGAFIGWENARTQYGHYWNASECEHVAKALRRIERLTSVARETLGSDMTFGQLCGFIGRKLNVTQVRLWNRVGGRQPSDAVIYNGHELGDVVASMVRNQLALANG